LVDIITTFENIVSKHTDAPKEFITAAGYHLVSCTLGPHFVIPGARGVNNARPNLWFLLASIPGRFRRSTVQDFHNLAYREAIVEYRKEEMQETREEAIRNSYLTFLESGSPEGIVDHINDFNTDCFVIMSHEYGGILEGLRIKSYQQGIRDLLSKLYYGQGGYQYFSKKGHGETRRYIPEGKYVTMFTGIQDPRSYITEELFKQGLMRRIIVVQLKMTDERKKQLKERWKPYITHPGKHGRDEIEKLGRSIGKLMVRLMKRRKQLVTKRRERDSLYPHLQVDYMPNARENINEYAKTYDDQIIDQTDLQTMYAQSQGEKLDKLAAISAISRGNLRKMDGEPIVIIENSDVERAKAFLEEVTEGWMETIPDIGSRRLPTTTITDPAEKILTAINREGGVIQSSKLLQNTNMMKDEVKAVAITLMERGELFVARDNIGKGRPPLLFGTNKEQLRRELKAPLREDVGEDYEGPVAVLLGGGDSHRLEDLW